jgi:TPR repeat protein
MRVLLALCLALTIQAMPGYDFGKKFGIDSKGGSDMDPATLAQVIRGCELKKPESLYLMGVMHFYGQGRVPQDNEKAVEYFRDAAQQGSEDAQSTLGVLYGDGHIVEQDDIIASEYFKAAADKGYADSEWMYGRMLLEGRGVEKDYAKAREFLMRASKQAQPRAVRPTGDPHLPPLHPTCAACTPPPRSPSTPQDFCLD